MVSSEQAGTCRRHPDHSQQPGVCSCCLIEKLSSSTFSQQPKTTPWMVVASSCPSSFPTSPCHKSSHHKNHKTTSRALLGSIGFFARSRSSSSNNNYNGIMRKSKSVAFVSRNRAADGKKRGGFWSKLLHPTGKSKTTTSGKEVLKNSRTIVKERFQY